MSCHGEREGCTDIDAINYDLLAESEDNSCTFPDVLMRFVPMIDDSTQLGFGQEYLINGLNVRFDRIRFYVDDIALVTSKENFTSENTLLSTENIQLGEVGELKVADLQEIKFNVGVDPVTNNEVDPTSQPTNSPLFANHPQVQWDSISGYKFFLVEGGVDVNGDGIYQQDTTEIMSIHCGVDDNLKNIILPPSDSTMIDRVGYELIVEYDVPGIFANNYDLAGKLFTRPNSNPEFAVEIMNNVQNIFEIR